MAISLLEFANRQKVADALTEQGYVVSRATVNRWASGKNMPEPAARMIAKLFGHDPDTPKSAPAWAEALADETAMKVIAALADPELVAALPDAIAALRALPPEPDDSVRANGERQDQARAGQ